jgi:ankyrin repeat protein
MFTGFFVFAALLPALLGGCASAPDIHRPLLGASRAERAVRKGGAALDAVLKKPGAAESADSRGRTILHLAAEAGKPDAVDAALRAGCEVNRKDRAGKTALDLAFEHTDSRNHAETAERLILAGGQSDNPLFARFAPAALSADYDTRGVDGTAPLFYAVSQGCGGYARFILEKQADVNTRNAEGSTPLHEAVRLGRLDLIALLLENGADTDAQDAAGTSALHLPALTQEAAALLLSGGANPSLPDKYGDTPLHTAIRLGRPAAVVQTLLEGGAAKAEPQAKGARGKAAARNTTPRQPRPGADVRVKNFEGKTPLYLAVEEERREYIPLLIGHGAEIFARDNSGGTPFETALKKNSPLIPLLITPETIGQRDAEQNTPLHAAVKNRAGTGTIGLILDGNEALASARNSAWETALHLAVRQNDAEAGGLLLARGAGIFAANASGESPFSLSFPPKSPELREWMLTQGTLTARDSDRKETALHYAARLGLDGYIGRMVQLGADTEALNEDWETPLFIAVQNDSVSTIRALLDAGASIHARNRLGNSVLHAAVRNSLNTAETLIARGARINSQALDGKTALHRAVEESLRDASRVELIRLFVKNGAGMEIRDAEGNTPLMEAARSGFAAVVKLLADLGASPQARDFKGDTPLHSAVDSDRSELAALLLGYGVSIHAKNTSGISPYRLALDKRPHMASVLLTPDRLNVSDDAGDTPLHIAVSAGANPEVVNVILGMGANAAAVDAAGKTALRLAVDAGNWELAKLLTGAGSDPFLAAGDGKTPAEAALDKGPPALEALFSGEAVKGSDFKGSTVLHYAAERGDIEAIGQLLELGADKTRENISRETPAGAAKRRKQDAAAALLN